MRACIVQHMRVNVVPFSDFGPVHWNDSWFRNAINQSDMFYRFVGHLAVTFVPAVGAQIQSWAYLDNVVLKGYWFIVRGITFYSGWITTRSGLRRLTESITAMGLGTIRTRRMTPSGTHHQ